MALVDDRGMAEPSFERQPPQDLAAEQSVLGGMLLSKDAIADVIEALAPNDFYRPAHQAIYDCILDLYGRGVRLNALRPTRGVHTEGADQLADWTGVLVEPIESMTEAVLALATCDAACTGRVTDSLHLLMELDRPVRDLAGAELVEGWQPADIPAQMAPFGVV